jgi:signal transduction histidine kinase
MPLLSIPTRRRGPVACAAVLGAVGLVLLAGVSLYLLHVTDARLRTTEQATRQDNEARRQLRSSLAAFREAESAERGYLLTDDPALLASLRVAKEQLEKTFTELAANPRWSASGRAGLAAFVAQIREQTVELDRALTLHDAGQREAATALVRAGGGNAPAERMRSLVAAMSDDLIAQSDADTAAHQRQDAAALAFAVGGTVFAALVLLTACIVVAMQLRARHRGEAMLLAARDAAQTANSAKSRFLAAVSHDLRQPLHAIILFVAALRRRIHGDEALSMLDNIATAAAAMQRMFSALLDVARLDAGAVVVQSRSFVLEEVFRPLRARFTPLAAAKGLAFAIPESHLFVWTDPVLLESILCNLLANAVAYTAQGSVTMTALRNDQVLEIEVRDTGSGMAAERLDRIFDEFVHLDRADPSGHGVGLGLAIVRLLRDLLGARVSVHSIPGAGSVFTVHVPFVPGEVAPTTPPQAETAPNLAGLRILVLDDDPLVLQATTTEVADWGAQPLAVLSAAEAMAVMQRMAPAAPDAAIIDQDIIGDVSGVVLLDRIAARFGIALPAVIVTGATSGEVREELIESGHPWLLKPADPATLRRMLANAVAAARSSPLRPAPIEG